MMTCDDAHRLMARAAEGATLEPAEGQALERAALDAHLAGCETCRTALAGQRLVASMLRARPPVTPSHHFAARVRERLEAQSAGGMLELANWRAWGGSLAPLAAGLTLAAWLGVGLESSNGASAEAESLASWTRLADEPQASVFLQPGTTTDLLLETVLTGAAPDAAGDPDVR